ncbi:MAG TPA: hypothetical protein VF781_02610 [Solirubrobacteraceae bacterium]
MTILIILNVVLAAIVFGVIVGMKALAIRAERAAYVEPVVARTPRVRDHERARAAHARSARARRQVGPAGA